MMHPQAHPQPRPRRVVQRAVRKEQPCRVVVGPTNRRRSQDSPAPDPRPFLMRCLRGLLSMLLCGLLGALIAVLGAW